MRQSYCIFAVTVVVVLACSSPLSAAASTDKTETRFLRRLETSDQDNENQEERLSFSSITTIFRGGANTAKKTSAEAKQARAAAKQAQAALKQANAEAKLLKQMQRDDFIVNTFKNDLKAYRKAVGARKADKMPVGENVSRIVAQAEKNDDYLYKVFRALKKGGMSEDDVFVTLNVANTKVYDSFYYSYARFLSMSAN